MPVGGRQGAGHTLLSSAPVSLDIPLVGHQTEVGGATLAGVRSRGSRVKVHVVRAVQGCPRQGVGESGAGGIDFIGQPGLQTAVVKVTTLGPVPVIPHDAIVILSEVLLGQDFPRDMDPGA